MFCKHCGKIIDEDSAFCRFCGKSQSGNHSDAKELTNNKLHVEVDGMVRVPIAPEMPKFPKLKRCFIDHKIFLSVILVWFILNVIFLVAGDDRNGFWPHIYSYSETIWDYDRLEYNPFSKSYYTGKVGHPGPEQTKIDWDLKYYGWTEFLIYAVLIPVLIFFLYISYTEHNKNKPPKIINPDYDSLRGV